MLYALICNDRPNSVELRQKTRPEHLAYLATLGDAVKLAGPFLNDAGDSVGTLMVIEAADQSTAATIAADDPYKKAGLFASVEIKPWRWVLKNPEAK